MTEIWPVDEPGARCRNCGHPVAEAGRAIAVAGRHRHAVHNPDGYRYTIACYDEAPGCIASGETSAEASWFAGYTWQRAFCRGCTRHVGWLFRHKTGLFYGLVADADPAP